MLFPYDRVSEQVIPCPAAPDETPARMTTLLVQSLNRRFGCLPRLYAATGGTDLYITYHPAAFSCREYGESLGYLTAAISTTWANWVCGVAENGELVRLKFHMEQDGLHMLQQNTSGQAQEYLRDFCLCLSLPDPLSASAMAEVLRAMGRGATAVGLPWKFAAFADEQFPGQRNETASYCYITLSGRETVRDLLSSLTFSQKEMLWRIFLRDGVQPLEFEWLLDASRHDRPDDWLDWALALYMAMEETGYRLVRDSGRFELLNGGGHRVYYSVDHPSAAEHLLMKILFPINT